MVERKRCNGKGKSGEFPADSPQLVDRTIHVTYVCGTMEHEVSEPIEMTNCSTSDPVSVHARVEELQVLAMWGRNRQSLEDEMKRQALLEQLQMNEYVADTREKLRRIAKEGWQLEQAERSRRIESREAKISAFTTQQIEEAEHQNKLDLENARKYCAHHSNPQQVGASAQGQLTSTRREARSAERHVLWDLVKARGVQRKQVAASAFPNKPIEAAIETFKKWLSGGSFADNSVADRAIRNALDYVPGEATNGNLRGAGQSPKIGTSTTTERPFHG